MVSFEKRQFSVLYIIYSHLCSPLFCKSQGQTVLWATDRALSISNHKFYDGPFALGLGRACFFTRPVFGRIYLIIPKWTCMETTTVFFWVPKIYGHRGVETIKQSWLLLTTAPWLRLQAEAEMKQLVVILNCRNTTVHVPNKALLGGAVLWGWKQGIDVHVWEWEIQINWIKFLVYSLMLLNLPLAFNTVTLLVPHNIGCGWTIWPVQRAWTTLIGNTTDENAMGLNGY